MLGIVSANCENSHGSSLKYKGRKSDSQNNMEVKFEFD
jgi:hypothetical protein